MKIIFKGMLIFFFSVLMGLNAWAGNDIALTQMSLNTVNSMSLEQMLNATVTSSAGRKQSLNDVANAMFVITKDDIERSGARHLADLLYRVPGMQIRQFDGHIYLGGIRESSLSINDDILVLVDGAIVFNPFIGVGIWQNLPVSLNEIERIEIIRGAPGVLYSANAVNGVVNIITKSADTGDNYVSQQGGTQSYRDSSIGVGGKISSTGLAIRAYFDNEFNQGFPKFVPFTDMNMNYVGEASDRYLSYRGGVRLDYTPSDHQRLSVIANDNNSGANDIISPVDYKEPGQTTSGIINYSDKVTDVYDYSLHFDYVKQVASFYEPNNIRGQTIRATTQHNFNYDLLGTHITSVGGEINYNVLDVIDGFSTNSHPTQRIISFFAQDEYRPIQPLILTAGLREDTNTDVIDHKPLYSPKASALYHITDDQSVWASSSLTYRTPSLQDRDLNNPLGGLNWFGSTDLKPEESYTQELGYRALVLNQRLKFDANIFYEQTDDMIVMDDTTGVNINDGALTTKGAEINADFSLTDNLSLSADYTYNYPHIKPEGTNQTMTLIYDDGISNNIVGLGLRYTLHQLKIDLYGKYFEGYTDPRHDMGADTLGKIHGYYKTFLNISYDFQTPRWAGKLDTTVYLSAIDLFGARLIEDSIYATYLKPEVSGGVKIRF